MQISTIKFSQLEDRIDAEYYKPEYLELENNLKNNKHIADVTNFISRGPQPIYTSIKTNYFVITSKFLNNFLLDTSNLPNVLDNFFDKFSTFQLKYGDILMYSTGAYVGSVSIFLENINSLASNHVTIIRSNKKINPFYLGIFLCSNLGNIQVYRNITGATQKEIFVDKIKQFLIPIPSQSFQQEIEKMVKGAQRKRKLADEKYKEAEEILNKKLGLENLDLSTQKTFETRFSEMEDRFDPEYYQPVFKKIEKIFKKQKVINLGDISSKIKYGTSEDLFYTEKGMPFLRVTDINKFSNIELKEGKFISNFDAKRLKEYQVKNDDIIISRTGTLGLAIYINEKLDGAIYGSYFIKVKPQHKDLSNKFIAYFISSKMGKLQTSRCASGGIQTNLTIDAIKSIQIPILSKPTQQKISSLIQKSFQLHQEAKELIMEAKKEVEEMVIRK